MGAVWQTWVPTGELISRPGTYKDIYDIQMSSDDRRLLTEGGEA